MFITKTTFNQAIASAVRAAIAETEQRLHEQTENTIEYRLEVEQEHQQRELELSRELLENVRTSAADHVAQARAHFDALLGEKQTLIGWQTSRIAVLELEQRELNAELHQRNQERLRPSQPVAVEDPTDWTSILRQQIDEMSLPAQPVPPPEMGTQTTI
jgi:hypothetical protein